MLNLQSTGHTPHYNVCSTIYLNKTCQEQTCRQSVHLLGEGQSVHLPGEGLGRRVQLLHALAHQLFNVDYNSLHAQGLLEITRGNMTLYGEKGGDVFLGTCYHSTLFMQPVRDCHNVYAPRSPSAVAIHGQIRNCVLKARSDALLV